MSRASRVPSVPKIAWGLNTPDTWLGAIVVGLIAFGVVMVYSASAVYASRTFGDGYHFLFRQATFAVVALVVVFVGARFDVHRLRWVTYPALALSVALMVVVAFGFGHDVGGAARWIAFGPVNVQPAELAKLAMILWLAHSLAKKQDKVQTFSIGFLPHVLIAGGLMVLCLAQPDFGSAVMLGLLTFVMLFAAGAKTGYLFGAGLLALPVGYLLITSSPYRLRRIRAFLEPFEHRQDAGFQITQSLMAFGSGGADGVGLGDSRQKLLFLPEAHTDFISAIIGEELGFIGVFVLCAAFLGLVWFGLRAALAASDDYSTYLGVGCTMFIGLQAFTNLGVALGLLPTKGLALPFVSYGGSSLLVNAAAVAVLLSVARAGGGRPAAPVSKSRTKQSKRNAGSRSRVAGRKPAWIGGSR